jgi:hypothetical protein
VNRLDYICSQLAGVHAWTMPYIDLLASFTDQLNRWMTSASVNTVITYKKSIPLLITSIDRQAPHLVLTLNLLGRSYHIP